MRPPACPSACMYVAPEPRLPYASLPAMQMVGREKAWLSPAAYADFIDRLHVVLFQAT